MKKRIMTLILANLFTLSAMYPGVSANVPEIIDASPEIERAEEQVTHNSVPEGDGLFYEFKAASISELRSLFFEKHAEFSFWEEGQYTDSELCVIILDAWQKGFGSFEELDQNVSAAADRLKAMKTAPELLGLSKQNRDVNLGAKEKTDGADVFQIDGREFIVLDCQKDKSGKTNFFVMTKDVYGQQRIDSKGTWSKDTYSKWDDKEPTNLAYKMTNAFAFNNFGPGGISLPGALFPYMEMMHAWNTEPGNCEGFETESVVISPLSILSVTEYKNYIQKIGVDRPETGGDGYWVRSSRGMGENGHYAHLAVSYGTASIAAGDMVNPGAIADGYYVRPVFYLNESFFRNEKLEKCGSNITKILDHILTKDEVQNLYSPGEIEEVFGTYTVTPEKLSGNPIVGETLKASYTYNGGIELESVSITWEKAGSNDGNFETIKNAKGEEYTISDQDEGQYIRAVFTPKFRSAILGDGAKAYSGCTGCIFGEKQIHHALAAINSADKDTITEILKNYRVLFDFDPEDSAFDDNARELFCAENINSLEEIRDNFKTACALSAYNAAQSDLKTYAENKYLLGERSDYNGLKEKEAFLAELAQKRPYISINIFMAEAQNGIALARFNNTDRTEIKALLKEYSIFLELDVKNFSDYQLELIGAQVAGKAYPNIDAVRQIVKAATERILATPSPSPSVGAGGGGGGGGKVVPPVAARTPAPAASHSPIPEKEPFNDISRAPWAKESIVKLYEKKIIIGNGQGGFEPDRFVTRNEFVKMVVTAFSLKADISDISYDDIKKDDWSFPYAAVVKALGIADGVSSTSFGNGQNITRQDMAVISVRLLAHFQTDLPAGGSIYSDEEEIAGYAKEAVQKLSTAGIMAGVGDNRFAPTAYTTRAMAAVVIDRIMKVQEDRNG